MRKAGTLISIYTLKEKWKEEYQNCRAGSKNFSDIFYSVAGCVKQGVLITDHNFYLLKRDFKIYLKLNLGSESPHEKSIPFHLQKIKQQNKQKLKQKANPTNQQQLVWTQNT